MKFKVGDKVKIVELRCKDVRDENYYKMLYNISEIVGIDGGYYEVRCITDSTDYWWFLGYELELVEEKPKMETREELELVEEKPKMETREELERQLAEIKAKLDKLPKKYVVEGYTENIDIPCKSYSLHKCLGLDGFYTEPNEDAKIKVRITIEEIKE